MSIRDNIRRVEDRIADACAQAKRDPSEIALVAISKQKSPADILEAVAAGLRHFGENRVEEGGEKIPRVKALCGAPLVWHMVGHVQSRKAMRVISSFDVVQSVDSLKLAKRLARFAGESQRRLQVYLEINVSGEASKFGLAGYNWYGDASVRECLWREVGAIADLPQFDLRGLMTMAPYDASEPAVRRVFADLRALRDDMTDSLNIPLPELSMGMTNDYPIAIEEGATTIRIGRAIFGERQ